MYRLADLCEQYGVGFEYTRDDDGIHIIVAGEEVFVGFLSDAAEALRRAVVGEGRADAKYWEETIDGPD